MRGILPLIVLVGVLGGCSDFVVSPSHNDFSTPLCGGYKLSRSSAHQIGVWNVTPVIPAKVVELGHDKRYIIAKQNHLKNSIPDPGVFSYWIVDTTGNKHYGPFTKSEFDKNRKKLTVPLGLSMKDVHSYK